MDLNPGMSALDVRGGTGRLSILLADRVGSVVVTHPSAGMVQVERGRIEEAGISDRVRAVQADRTTDQLGGCYDVVWSSMALHHVRDLDRLFRSVAGLLVDGGRLAIADLDEDPDGAFHADKADFDGNTDSTGNASSRSWLAPAWPMSASLTPRPSSRATASSACSCAPPPRLHERSPRRTRRCAPGGRRSGGPAARALSGRRDLPHSAACDAAECARLRGARHVGRMSAGPPNRPVFQRTDTNEQVVADLRRCVGLSTEQATHLGAVNLS